MNILVFLYLQNRFSINQIAISKIIDINKLALKINGMLKNKKKKKKNNSILNIEDKIFSSVKTIVDNRIFNYC